MRLAVSLYRSLAVVVCLTVLTGVALAGPLTVDVFASIAPDPFSSNSTFLGWSANALNALESAARTSGTSGFPQYYATVGSFAATDVIGTNFPYWRGTVNPTGNYTGQTGNMLMFPLAVYGNGTQFTMNDVSFTDNFFGTTPVTTALSTVGYGARMVGIGADGTIYNGVGGAPGTAVGTASTPVVELFFSGFGDQFGSLSTPGAPMTLAELPAGLAEIAASTDPTASGAYTVRLGEELRYQGSANLEMVPEPATLSFGCIGMLLLGLAARRKGRV